MAGYDAWNAGTAVGLDRLFSDTLTFGVSGGYAYGKVNSDANEAKTNINSAQGTIYAGYQDANIPYFIDAAGSFAWNWYKGKRDISVGTINRTAYSDYD
ncbi:MAG: autotransporter outer membrane beta-barrel domain-containing protein, partial [Candidatus Omnitrophica bacterium]|nr:autotransporter outer membrane beta-barrel domain-containing protein [Candidatus Omnitrophota bacterium]